MLQNANGLHIDCQTEKLYDKIPGFDCVLNILYKI